MLALIFSPFGRILAALAILSVCLVASYGKGRLDQKAKDGRAALLAENAALKRQAADAALINSKLADEKAKAESEREATDKRRQELESALDSVRDLDCVDAATARRLRGL